MTATEDDSTHELFCRAGQALYGPRFASDIGRALAMSDRNIRRYVAGDLQMSPSLRLEIANLCMERAEYLAEVASELRTSALADL